MYDLGRENTLNLLDKILNFKNSDIKKGER